MKPSILALITLFLLLGRPILHAAEEPLVEKKKTYSKSYPLAGTDHVNLDNQFGEMKIISWNRNEIKVDIVMEARANTDEMAQKILDNIYIEDSKSGPAVTFRTKMKNQKNNWNNKKDYKEMGMSINYAVYMPVNFPLNATNQFGPMILPDFSGPLNATSKFGSITAGRLTNVKSLNMEFGEARVESVNGGVVSLKFGKADIRLIQGNTETRIEFCDKVRLGVDNSTRDLNIRSSYSKLYLNAANNCSSSFDIKTSFGEFTNKSSFNIKKQGGDDDSHGPKFDKQFNGTSGNGSNRLRVKSEFGEVILGHNLDVDFNSKGKPVKV